MQWVVQIQFMNRNTLLRWLCEDLNVFQNQRGCYKLLRNDYKLPSISTLIRLTPKVSNIEDSSFVRNVFQSLNDGKKLYFVDQWSLCKANSFAPCWTFIR